MLLVIHDDDCMLRESSCLYEIVRRTDGQQGALTIIFVKVCEN